MKGEGTPILLLADDLTGAADSAVAFADRGLRTLVVLHGPPQTGESASTGWDLKGWDALAVDTNTRRASPEEAAATCLEVAALSHSDVAVVLYKKVDSTLRGNISSEIEALVRELDIDLAIVAPAYPALGRTTVQGIQHEHGSPVRTGAPDGELPATADVVALLRSSGLRVQLVPRQAMRVGVEAFSKQLLTISSDSDAAVIDSEQDDDLSIIARAGRQAAATGLRVLWVGSGGLAAHLPAAFDLAASPGASGEQMAVIPGPLLVVVGSASEVAHEQSAAVAQSPSVVTVKLDPAPPRPGDSRSDAAVKEAVDRAVEALAAGHDVLLTFTGDPAHPNVQAAQVAVQRLTMAAADAMTCGEPAGLIVTGGETARVLFDRLGTSALEILDAVDEGVPRGRLHDARCTPVVTKAGSFGDPHTLVNALRVLHGEG